MSNVTSIINEANLPASFLCLSLSNGGYCDVLLYINTCVDGKDADKYPASKLPYVPFYECVVMDTTA